jgi:hypothetical protein
LDKGVPVVVQNPQLKLFKGSEEIGTYGSWSVDPNLVPGMAAIFDFVGAFQFAPDSSDCAALVFLEPGSYTLHCFGAVGDAEVLMEAYALPIGD